ncbi:flagellar protein FlaG [Bowmanella yangjiangensis]|uniref:Flagellar protein FlaG n=1 Tax=Bowmanella yangjiangensis TaxID=2811230 RepID=A0ABS3CQ95_9ALTE|nr:flagellar protein FlaG [Bowmanella yangjiangensis]MBN7818850.1 flagellar protein FlaG [Bowmanella yangjiangensis]
MDVDFSQGGQSLARSDTLLQPRANLVDKQDQNGKEATKLGEQERQSQQEITQGSDVVADIKEADVELAVEQVREFVFSHNRQLSFSVDEDSRRSVIKVTDPESGTVIRQIPSEEVLKLAERIRELQSDVGAAVGVLFNKAV